MSKKIIFTLREKQSRSAKTSFIIIDAQSVKNTDTAKHHGYDGGKRISGIKRHLAVDINGLPQATRQQFEVLPQRWIIERSFNWLDKCRRLCKNCER